jgi:hypothetical protein
VSLVLHNHQIERNSRHLWKWKYSTQIYPGFFLGYAFPKRILHFGSLSRGFTLFL